MDVNYLIMEPREQRTSNPNMWLFQDIKDEQGNLIVRIFAKKVFLAYNAEPWPECTDEEKLAWEAAHPEPEPEEPAAEPIQDMQQQAPTIDQTQAPE